MHQLHVELTGVVKGALDRVFGDLVEHHPLNGHLRIKELQQVPTDRFPFPVFVCGQQQLICALEGVF